MDCSSIIYENEIDTEEKFSEIEESFNTDIEENYNAEENRRTPTSRSRTTKTSKKLTATKERSPMPRRAKVRRPSTLNARTI